MSAARELREKALAATAVGKAISDTAREVKQAATAEINSGASRMGAPDGGRADS